jgi:hypothetical protein
MTPEELIERNTKNSAASTGPRTPTGKRRSSLNAYRNGLNGQIVCGTPEELQAFQKFCGDIRDELAPVGPIETALAVSISEDMFRLQRARAIENGIFANGFRANVDEIESGHAEVDTALAAAKCWEQQAHQLSLLTVYQGRIQRGLEKNQAQLKAMQAERKERYERAADQAATFIIHAGSKGETYEPGEDFMPASAYGGFVFSEEEIIRREDRKLRYNQAWRYRNSDRRPRKEADVAARPRKEVDLAA